MQARLAYAMDKFLREGRVPDMHEGNKKEPLMPLGHRWNGYGQIVIGASLEAACESPTHLSAAIAAFPAKSAYVLTYRPDKDKVFVVLRQGANRDDALEGAFLAHLWLSRLHDTVNAAGRKCMAALPADKKVRTCGADKEVVGAEALEYVRRHRQDLWRKFSRQAEHHGWQMHGTMLAIGDSRLLTSG